MASDESFLPSILLQTLGKLLCVATLRTALAYFLRHYMSLYANVVNELFTGFHEGQSKATTGISSVDTRASVCVSGASTNGPSCPATCQTRECRSFEPHYD
jgi:hypothetical protein